MIHMHWEPTDCKHHHNNDEHSDDFFLGDFLLSLVMIYRHFVEPQFSSNYDVENGDDGERQKVVDNKDVAPKGHRRYSRSIKAAGTIHEFEGN